MSSGGMAGGFQGRGGRRSQEDAISQDASAAAEEPVEASSSEPGGFHKGRGRDQEASSEESSPGEMPEMPQMPDGEPPEIPDGEMPQMPDGESPSVQDLPSDSQGPGMTGREEAAGSDDTASSSKPEEAAEKTSSYDSETYLLSAASVMVLAAGLAAALAFRRHR
jgi:hypothetical protein